jgi:hypothetical protein
MNLNRFIARICMLSILLLLQMCSPVKEEKEMIDDKDAFVQVSTENPAYFELSNGSTYIPNGFNLVNPPEEDELEEVVLTMAGNQINYCRVWLGLPLWDIEHEKSGVYDEEKAKILDRFLELCYENGIKVKMCLEYFRDCPADKNRWSDKIIHNVANGGYYESMEEFIDSEKGHEQFKQKLKFYQERYGDRPEIFAWELWNEVNCVKGDYLTWTKIMLPELHRLFPKNLAVQSLGSYDYEGYREEMYRPMCMLETNDVTQVHRYLDLGARWEVCHGPADVLAAEAVREMLNFNTGKPVVLAETGAVKPKHTGYSEIYDLDTVGVLNHDQLFTPFFAGAAGTGNAWWWRQSIDKFDQWYLFNRFAEAVKGIDPVKERFEPFMIPHEELRIYALKGNNTLIAWCKDIHNDWRSEFEMGLKPKSLEDLSIDLTGIIPDQAIQNSQAYDPWTDTWSTQEINNGQMSLPSFKRSIVFKVDLNN